MLLPRSFPHEGMQNPRGISLNFQVMYRRKIQMLGRWCEKVWHMPSSFISFPPGKYSSLQHKSSPTHSKWRATHWAPTVFQTPCECPFTLVIILKAAFSPGRAALSWLRCYEDLSRKTTQLLKNHPPQVDELCSGSWIASTLTHTMFTCRHEPSWDLVLITEEAGGERLQH